MIVGISAGSDGAIENKYLCLLCIVEKNALEFLIFILLFHHRFLFFSMFQFFAHILVYTNKKISEKLNKSK